MSAETPMRKTLAAKHDSTVPKMAARHRATIGTPHGPRRCFEAVVERAGKQPLVTRFGGLPLRKQTKAVLTDQWPPLPHRPKELIAGELRAGNPQAVKVWEDAWDQVTPFLAFTQPVRKLLYTTNSIEPLNYQLRKVTKARGHFPSDEANELAIAYPGRIR